ncbi:hypothetical protein TARUN_2642 [Trichoderma arundinaceum]|uniref:F-box domain-containing protein n=1 Tax=Trichoderma arundinaceum TaxID=490622 RepID=A0A395NUC6_TRIAR|nr:hypothetical protein TARUN_2642 [Trichoderma arundinaceum]
MAARGILQKIIQKKRGKRNAPPNARSALLNLPIELIRDISDELSAVDKVIFATTCRPVRNTLGLTQLSDSESDSQEQQFDYLARMCRDMPGKWVCEECMRCHDINSADTPTNPYLACPFGNVDHGRFNRPLRLIAREEYRLGRRHIQLALKYTRLGSEAGSKYRRYLRRLMSSRQYSYSYMWKDARVNNLVKITPRVVNGRFLLKSIFEYRRKSRPISKEIVDHEFICRHQNLIPEEDLAWIRNPGSNDLLNFQRALGDAFSAPGHEMHSHCPHCFTDFSVKASPKSIRITVWQDLGTESSPLDPVWKSFVYTPYLYSDAASVRNEEPGRVRELYDSEEA